MTRRLMLSGGLPADGGEACAGVNTTTAGAADGEGVTTAVVGAGAGGAAAVWGARLEAQPEAVAMNASVRMPIVRCVMGALLSRVN